MNSVCDELLHHMASQHKAHAVRGMLGVIPFLELKNLLPISKSKLRCGNCTVKFDHPQV